MAGGLYLPQITFTASTANAVDAAVSKDALNSVATTAAEQQVQAAASWAPLRDLYGRDRLGADLYDYGVLSGNLVLFWVWGLGPWDGIDSFTLDDAPPAAGVTVRHYDGTQTAPDPTLVQLYGVTDAATLGKMVYPKLVYSVGIVAPGVNAGFPQAQAIWRGRKLFDPRNGPSPDTTSLALSLTVVGGGNCYTYRRIAAPGYTVQSGDVLSYDFWVDPASTIGNVAGGGIEVDLSAAPGAGRSAGLVDGDGALIVQPAIQPPGIWRSRSIALAQVAGNIVTSVDLVCESDTAGYYRVLYRNIRISRANGSVLTIWAAGNPSVNADAYSARVVGVTVAEVQATQWSSNSSLALADFRSRCMGDTLDWASVAICANANDALVSGQPRRAIGLTITNMQYSQQWSEALRAYAGCWVVPGSPTRLVPDRPASPVMTFSPASGNIIDLSEMSFADTSESPNVLEVQWTNTSKVPWFDDLATATTPDVDAGRVVPRVQRVSMPGYHDGSMALREAIERLNTFNLCDLSFDSLRTPDSAAVVEVGDCVALDGVAGMANKPFRVVAKKGSLGDYQFALTEYDPGKWSDAVAVAGSAPDTKLPSPTSPPAITGLAVIEEVYQLDSGLWASRFRATWTAPTWPYLQRFRSEAWAGATLIFSGSPDDATWVTPAIQEGQQYLIRVAAVSSIGVCGTWANATITAQGKTLLPGDVPTLTGFEVGGEVRLTIGASTDLDMTGYEVRYGQVGVSWSAARFCDFVNAASGVGGYCIFKDAPAGTWDFLVCARDSVGQYSPTPARVQIPVTLDVNAYLIGNHDYTAPAVQWMVEYSIPGDSTRYFVTDDGIAASTKFQNVAATYTDIAATYHASVASIFATEAWDVGALVAANWSGTMATLALSGSKADVISLSPNGATYIDQSGLTAKANGRFAKLKSMASGAATLKAALPSMRLRADVVPHEEHCPTGSPITSSASGPTTVTLAGTYVAFTEPPSITPLGASACSYTVDNIITGNPSKFDVYIWSGSTQVARQFYWSVKGI